MTLDEQRIDWDWLDSISFVDAEETVLNAHRHLLPTEWYFKHHFASFPVVPGVLLIEMMAHASAYLQILRVLRATSVLPHYILAGANNSRFYRHVSPGDHVDLSATLRQGDDEQVLMRAEAAVAGCRVGRTEIMLQRIRGSWLAQQDQIVRNALRRLLSHELKAKYELL
jgi:3-hydroxyacyl-[acyl-carrier-protein] dehydratase